MVKYGEIEQIRMEIIRVLSIPSFKSFVPFYLRTIQCPIL